MMTDPTSLRLEQFINALQGQLSAADTHTRQLTDTVAKKQQLVSTAGNILKAHCLKTFGDDAESIANRIRAIGSCRTTMDGLNLKVTVSGPSDFLSKAHLRLAVLHPKISTSIEHTEETWADDIGMADCMQEEEITETRLTIAARLQTQSLVITDSPEIKGRDPPVDQPGQVIAVIYKEDGSECIAVHVMEIDLNVANWTKVAEQIQGVAEKASERPQCSAISQAIQALNSELDALIEWTDAVGVEIIAGGDDGDIQQGQQLRQAAGQSALAQKKAIKAMMRTNDASATALSKYF